MSSRGVLDGFTVVEVSTGASAPYGARLLADWGARVVKVERPGGDVSREWDTVCNGLSAGFVWLNRNKESIVLDLRREDARDALRRLVARADVLLHNYLDHTASRLGFSYEHVREWKPDVVYCQISGYGRTGPYAEMKAYDLLMQGETGVLAMTGSEDAMAKVPLSICDLTTGSFAANAIQGALIHRLRTGEGQAIHVSMFASMMDWLGYFPYFYWHRGRLPEREGAKHHLLTPYGPYETSDAHYVNLAVLSQEHWVRFCRDVLEDEELAADVRFDTNEHRIANRAELESFIAERVLEDDQATWIERLERSQIPWGRVNRLDEVLAHPALAASGQLKAVESARGLLPTMDNPVVWSTTANRLDRVPELGEHTSSVLAELEFSDGEIDSMLGAADLQPIATEPRTE